MASPAEVRQQRALLDRVTELAVADLARAWQRVDTSADFDVLRPELVALLARLVELYGEAAAGLAADYYESARGASPEARGRFSPQLPEVVTEAVRGALVGAVGVSIRGIVSGDPGMTLRDLSGALDLQVKGAHRRTIAHAVATDPANAAWERVPTGSECDFCQDLAGQIHTSPAAAESDFHAHCRCMSMPVWLRR